MKRHNWDEHGMEICEEGRWVRYEDAEKLQGLATKEQLAEAATTARLPLLQAIKDLEAQVKVLREDREKDVEPEEKYKTTTTGISKWIKFGDHLKASMDVVELARKPLIEQIKALESQVKEAREDSLQDRLGLASMVGMLRGLLCPPMDQDHLDELIAMVSANDEETSTYAVKEIAVRLLRANKGSCSGCDS